MTWSPRSPDLITQNGLIKCSPEKLMCVKSLINCKEDYSGSKSPITKEERIFVYTGFLL